MSAPGYHAVRLPYDRRKAALWGVLVRHGLQRLVPPGGRVLDLGCGQGYFINAVAAPERYAMDLEPSMRDHLAPGIRFLTGDATEGIPLPDAGVDLVFASNLLEHLEHLQVERLLASARRVLSSGGRLVLLQPNYRLCPRRYFDDYTHRSVWTDVSLQDRLRASGFRILRVEPRCLPFRPPGRPGPLAPLAARAYLALPWRPFAAQMLVVAGP